VTDGNGCISRSSLALTTATEEIFIANLKVYPNPANDELHIDLNLPATDCGYTWTLQNMIGQSVGKGEIMDCKQFVIHTGLQPEGRYQLTLTGDGKTISYPIILTNR
jgi:hypothetical protein